ncbi:MAG: folylpolyglutamate synthase/dihydrofolate synthase family protein [Methanomassiliicoccales archaeon]
MVLSMAALAVLMKSGDDERQAFLTWLFSLENAGIKLGLENMRELMRRLCNPEHDYTTLHVTGTNGKGSVCTFLASALESQGYKTALYTSPHLVDFEERISINGKQIDRAEMMDIAMEVKEAAEGMLEGEKRLTFFEFTTAMAFLYFSKKKVDAAVVEVGLGGRLDATNVVMPLLSIITHLELEHTAYLGNTIGEIAFEKGGIIKEGVPLVTHEGKEEALSVLRKLCKERNSELICNGRLASAVERENRWGTLVVNIEGENTYTDVKSALWGSLQKENIETAVTALEQAGKRGLYLADKDIRNGIERAFLPGRLQIAAGRKEVLFDVGHNPDAFDALSISLSKVCDEKLPVLLGVLSDKNIAKMMPPLSRIASKVICTSPRSPRAFPADVIKKEAEKCGITTSIADSVADGMEMLEEEEGKRAIVTGSFRTVGEAMLWWRDKYGKELWKRERT